MMRTILVLLALSAAFNLAAQNPANTPVSGRRYARILIHNAMVIEGNGTPAAGPKDIVIENNLIRDVIPLDPVALGRNGSKSTQADVVIDATGKYVMPGLINAHAHTQDERGGMPQPIEYELKIWLACGITTVRDVGSDPQRRCELRQQSAEGEIAAPRIFVYPMFNRTPRRATPTRHAPASVNTRRWAPTAVKMLGIYRDVMEAMEDEAHKLGLRVAHHVGVEETNAWDDIRFGTTSIEHWYGIPDAAIEAGVQNFPSSYNYNNETDRFRYAGHLWREANPERLTQGASTAWWRPAWPGTPRWISTKPAATCSARRPSPGSPSICIRRSQNTSSRIPPITGRTSSAGPPPTKRSGRRTTASGWLRCASSTGAAD